MRIYLIALTDVRPPLSAVQFERPSIMFPALPATASIPFTAAPYPLQHQAVRTSQPSTAHGACVRTFVLNELHMRAPALHMRAVTVLHNACCIGDAYTA